MNTKKILIVFFTAVFFCKLFFLSAETLAAYGSTQYQSNVILLAQADTENTSDSGSEIKNFIDEGRRFYRQRLYEKAIDTWEKALKLDQGNAKIKKYIARAKAKIGITSEVQEKQKETPQTASTPDQVNDLIDQGRTYYRDGKYEDAIAVWEQAYKLDPENKRLQRYLMKAREKVAKKAPKKEPVKVTEQKSNEGAEQLISKGKEYFRRGEYAKAIEQWRKALALQPDDIKIQRYIEKAQKNLTETESAVASQEETAKPAEQPAEPAKPTEETIKEQAIIDEETIAKEEQVVRRDLSWCVKIAIENHREARIAEEKIKKAEIDVFIARRNFFPNLFFVYSTAQGGSGSDQSGAGTRDFVRNRYKFQASHMVYTGGKARSEVQKANIALDIEKKDYERIVGQKALEVAKAYYEVARTEADLKVQIDLLKEAKAALQLVEEQFKSGLVSELELLNLKAQINQLYSQVAAAQQEISHAVLDLQNVMNIDLTTPIRVYPLEDTEIEMDQRYIDIPLIKNIQTYAPSAQQNVDEKNQLRQDSYVIFALKNRADFAVEQLKLEKASKDIDIAQSEFLPHFEVFGELGQGAEDTAQKLSDLDLITEYTAGVKLSWNIWGNTFEMSRQENSEAPSVTKIGTEKSREWNVSVGLLDNLEPISNKQEFVVKHLEALNDLANQKNTIIEEVRDAYHNFLKAKIAKDTAKSKIEFRKKTVELYNLQRSLGELETSKLVQAQIDLATENAGLHKALADYFIQLASLDTAIGKNIFYKEQVSLPDINVAAQETPAQEKPQEDIIVSFTGYLFKLEKVTIGPATHKIVKGFRYRKWVALARSGTIDLNQYLGKEVTVSGISVNTEDWIDTVIVDSIQLTEKQKIKDSKLSSKNNTEATDQQPAVPDKDIQETDSKENANEAENKEHITEKDNSA